MKYSIEPFVFAANPDVCFGVVVGRGLHNTESSGEDRERLLAAERSLQERLKEVDIKEEEYIKRYRAALQNVGINPNKFTNSVEGMAKRVGKGHSLPSINALVDLCNAISLEEVISLGGHDLREIKDDLWVRRSRSGDRYLPFGSQEYEHLGEGELVFISGDTVQTRQWLWRQSEIGKMTSATSDVFFQLVGFAGSQRKRLEQALAKVETMVVERFGGSSQTFLVDKDCREIDF
jgi:DNA/RNA-binding domain of Phe-tRNA-synthetase-like protein